MFTYLQFNHLFILDCLSFLVTKSDDLLCYSNFHVPLHYSPLSDFYSSSFSGLLLYPMPQKASSVACADYKGMITTCSMQRQEAGCCMFSKFSLISLYSYFPFKSGVKNDSDKENTRQPCTRQRRVARLVTQALYRQLIALTF